MADQQGGIGDAELPLPTIEYLKQKMAAFLEKNPASKIEMLKVPNPAGGPDHEVPRVSSPWGDYTLAIILLQDVEKLASVLNNVYLPARLSALWHQDTKDIEVIWTALPLSPSQNEINRRKFTFQFSGKKYKCEFGRSSDRLLTLAKYSFPETNPSETNFRNLLSFARMAREEDGQKSIEYNPRSFWIRNVRLSDKQSIRLIENLNFYLSYYDAESPAVMVHDIHPPVNKRTRYIEDRFPSLIIGRELDENLVSFWEATRHQNPMLKFIFYYRIIEYASSNFLSGDARAKLAKLLANPTLCTPSNLEASINSIISAFDGAQAAEVPRFNNLLTASVNPATIWKEIDGNKLLFIESVKFDGGYQLANIISKDETLATFSGGGMIKFANAIRNIRNVLVHGRDQNTATAITPTPRNMKYLSAWVNVIAAAAGEVVLYGTNT